MKADYKKQTIEKWEVACFAGQNMRIKQMISNIFGKSTCTPQILSFRNLQSRQIVQKSIHSKGWDYKYKNLNGIYPNLLN